MFENNLTLQNFLRNISECTKVGGYFIATSYDGETIFRALSNKSVGESIVINQDESKIWEVKKMYDNITFDDDISSVGYAIDVYQETINKVFREYLVNFNYLTRLMENYGFVQITDVEAKELGVPSSSGMFNELYNEMEQEISRNRNKANDYGLADKMTSGEKRISFLNRYFIYKKIRNVDAEAVANSLLDTSKQNEKEIENESKTIEKLIKDKSKVRKVIRKLKQRIKLVMEDEEELGGVEETKEGEFEQKEIIEDIEKRAEAEQTQQPLVEKQSAEKEALPPPPQPTQIPLIKKKGRPKKLIIQEDITLPVENIPGEIENPPIKKRGRPKKVNKD